MAGDARGPYGVVFSSGLLVIPVSMVISIFVPTSGLPGWLRAIAE